MTMKLFNRRSTTAPDGKPKRIQTTRFSDGTMMKDVYRQWGVIGFGNRLTAIHQKDGKYIVNVSAFELFMPVVERAAEGLSLDEAIDMLLAFEKKGLDTIPLPQGKTRAKVRSDHDAKKSGKASHILHVFTARNRGAYKAPVQDKTAKKPEPKPGNAAPHASW